MGPQTARKMMVAKFLNAAKNAKLTSVPSVALVAMGLSGTAAVLSLWVLLRVHRCEAYDEAATSLCYSAFREEFQLLRMCATTAIVIAATAMALSFWCMRRVRELRRELRLEDDEHSRELATDTPSTLLLLSQQVLSGSGSFGSLASALLVGF